MSHRLRGLTTRLAGLTARMPRLRNMVVLNAVGTDRVALNACVGLSPTREGMFSTAWEFLTDLMRSDQSVGIVTCARIR